MEKCVDCKWFKEESHREAKLGLDLKEVYKHYDDGEFDGYCLFNPPEIVGFREVILNFINFDQEEPDEIREDAIIYVNRPSTRIVDSCSKFEL